MGNDKQELRQNILVELQALQKLMKGDPAESPTLYTERYAALLQQYKEAVSFCCDVFYNTFYVRAVSLPLLAERGLLML
jgi:hypothetical protein